MKKITFENLATLPLLKYSKVNRDIEVINDIIEVLKENDYPMTCTEISVKGKKNKYYDIPEYSIQKVSATLKKMFFLGIVKREEVEIENPYSFTIETNKHNLYYENGNYAGFLHTGKWEEATITVKTKIVFSLI